MKVTHSRTGKEVELPKYFKSGIASFMLTEDNKNYVKVVEDSWEFGMNYIRKEPAMFLPHEDIDMAEHISETEFKTVFLRVSVLIEETLNN